MGRWNKDLWYRSCRWTCPCRPESAPFGSESLSSPSGPAENHKEFPTSVLFLDIVLDIILVFLITVITTDLIVSNTIHDYTLRHSQISYSAIHWPDLHHLKLDLSLQACYYCTAIVYFILKVIFTSVSLVSAVPRRSSHSRTEISGAGCWRKLCGGGLAAAVCKKFQVASSSCRLLS